MQKRLSKIMILMLMVMTLTMGLPTLHTTATEPSDTWISNEYLPYIKEISSEYHICPEMVMAIIEHESSGQANAENGGCKGLMQIYEKYHRDRMERLGVEDLYDPYGNILVGCDYLEELFEKYKGDMSTVLMIYSGTSDALNRTYENRTEYAKSIMNRTVELERLHEEAESDFGEGL
jgi:soluble lytic murein transglycosylase-like protein|nr:MAG TPA: hypothetical protein [Caudoviricetes sp.]